MGYTQYGGLAVVSGYLDGNNTVSFIDLILTVNNGTVVVVSSNTRNSPAARTYSIATRNIQVAMASGTYKVTATTLS